MTTLLIDTKDLINLVEHDAPMTRQEFSSWSADHDLRLVLTFTNVSEFADTIRASQDLLYVRSILQAVEALPAVYLQESLIEVSELEAAIEAFNAGTEPSPHDPFVSRWDYTFKVRGEEAPHRMIVNYRLDLMVFDLRGPDPRRSIRPQEVLGAIRTERAIPKAERLPPRRSLTRALERKIEFWGLTPPEDGIDAFGKWLYADPTRSPGLRLNWEAFHALVANDSDQLHESDLGDVAHFPAIPYVDYATLDRRMTGYCRDIARRLAKANSSCDYERRVFRSLEEFIAHLR